MRKAKKSIKEWASDDRPREKMIYKGKEALSNAELIALLIGSGSDEKSAVELARQILSDNRDSLAELSKMSLEELMQYRGIGEAKAVSIVAALELSNRRYIGEFFESPTINGSQEAFKLFRAHLTDLNNESFLTIFLNQSNKVVKVDQKNGIGSIAQVYVDVRGIFKKALLYNATGIIIGHNHPSGNVKPSAEDKELTKRIKAICGIMNISLLDHIIIGMNNYFSFAEEGIL